MGTLADAVMGVPAQRLVELPQTDPNLPVAPANISELGKGWARGAGGIMDTSQAAVGQLIQPFAERAGTNVIDAAQRRAAFDAAHFAADNPTWESVHGLEDAGKYVLGKVGEGAPALPLAYAGGLAGRAVLGAGLGELAGGTAAFAPQTIGGQAMHLNDPANVAATGMSPLEKTGRAIGGGLAEAAVMGAVPAAMGGALLAPEARSLTSTLLARPAVNTAGMGAGMAAGDLVGQGAQQLYDPNKQIDREQTKEAGIGGMAMGFPLAAAHAVPETLMSKGKQGVDAVTPLVETLTPERGAALLKRMREGAEQLAQDHLPASVNDLAAPVGDAAAKAAATVKVTAENAAKIGGDAIDAVGTSLHNSIADIAEAAGGAPMERKLSAKDQKTKDQADALSSAMKGPYSKSSADPVNADVRRVVQSPQFKEALTELGVSDDMVGSLAKNLAARVQMRHLSAKGMEKLATDTTTDVFKKLGFNNPTAQARVKNALLHALEPHREAALAERAQMDKAIQDSNGKVSDEFKSHVSLAVDNLVNNSGVKELTSKDASHLSGVLIGMVHGIAEGKKSYPERALPVAAELVRHFGSGATTALERIVDAARIEYDPNKVGLTPAQAAKNAKSLARLERLTEARSLITQTAAALSPHLNNVTNKQNAGKAPSPMKSASMLLREMTDALAADRDSGKSKDITGADSSRMTVLKDMLAKAHNRAMDLLDAKGPEDVLAKNKADAAEAMDSARQIQAEIDRHESHKTKLATDALFDNWVQRKLIKGGSPDKQRAAFHKIQEAFVQYERSPDRLDKPETSGGDAPARTTLGDMEDLDKPSVAMDEADSLSFKETKGSTHDAPLNADGTDAVQPTGAGWKAEQTEAATGTQNTGTMGATYHGTERLHPDSQRGTQGYEEEFGAPLSNHPSADYPHGQIRDEKRGVGVMVHSESGHRVAAGREVNVRDWAKDMVAEHGGDVETHLRGAMDRLIKHDATRVGRLEAIIKAKGLPANSLGMSAAEQKSQAKNDLYWINKRAEMAAEKGMTGEEFFNDEEINRGFKYYKTNQETASNLTLGAEELRNFAQRPDEKHTAFLERMKSREEAAFPDSVYENSLMKVELTDGTMLNVDVARLVNDVLRHHQKADTGGTLEQAFHEVMAAISTGAGVKQIVGETPFGHAFKKDAGFGERHREDQRRGFFRPEQVIYRESDVGGRGLRGDKRAVTNGQVNGGLDIDPVTKAFVNNRNRRNAEGNLEQKSPGNLVTAKEPLTSLVPKTITKETKDFTGEGMLIDPDGGRHNLNLRALMARMLERNEHDSTELLASGDIPPNRALDLLHEGLKELKDQFGLAYERHTTKFDEVALWEKNYGDVSYPTTWKQFKDKLATIDVQTENGDKRTYAPRDLDEARQADYARKSKELEELVAVEKAKADQRKARHERGDQSAADHPVQVKLDNEALSGAKSRQEALEQKRSDAVQGDFKESNITQDVFDQRIKDASPTGRMSDAPLFDRSEPNTRWASGKDSLRVMNDLTDRRSPQEKANAFYDALVGEWKDITDTRKQIEFVSKLSDAEFEQLKRHITDGNWAKKSEHNHPRNSDIPANRAESLAAGEPVSEPLVGPTKSRTLDTGNTPKPEYPSTALRTARALDIRENAPKSEGSRAEPEKLESGLEKSKLSGQTYEEILPAGVSSFNAKALAEQLNGEAYNGAKHPALMKTLDEAQKVALRKALEGLSLTSHNAGAKLLKVLPEKAPKASGPVNVMKLDNGTTITRAIPKELRSVDQMVKSIDEYSETALTNYVGEMTPANRDALLNRLDKEQPAIAEMLREKYPDATPFSKSKADPSATADADAIANVQKFLDEHTAKLVTGFRNILTKEKIGDDFSGQYNKATSDAAAHALISAFGSDILGHANHETWHHIETVLKSMGKEGEYVLDQIHKSTRTKLMDEMLKREFATDEGALSQMEDNSERASYMFQRFMKDGKFPIAPEHRGLWEHIKKWFMDLVGLTSGEAKAEAFFKYVADSGLVRDGIENPYATLRALGETKTDAFINKTREALKPLEAVYHIVMSSADERVRAHKNEHLDAIVDKYAGLSGKGGFHNAHVQALQQFGHQLDSIIETATPEQLKQRSTFDPLQSKLYEYMDKAGVSEKMQQAITERVASFDRDSVSDRMEEFMIDLVRYGGLPGDKAGLAKNIATKIADRGFYFDPELTLFKDHPEMAVKWHEKDMGKQIGNMIIQATKLTERQRAFGERTKEAPMGKDIKDLLDKAEASGASPEALKDMKSYMDGFDGKHDAALSPEMKKLVGGLLFAQNVALLPFSVVAQLMEPMQLAMRKNDMSGVLTSTWRGIKDFPRMFEGYDKGYNKDYWERFAAMAGTSRDRALATSFAQLSNGIASRGLTGKLNDMFFRYNGMEGMDQSMHIEATKHAVEFLKDHARGIDAQHSQRFLDELGVTKKDVLDAIKTVHDKQDGKTYETLELNDKLTKAISQYVEEAMAHPDAGSNPMWFNDPRMALLSQMKRFTFGFSKYVNDRNMSEIEKGNYQVMLPMVASIAWSLLLIDPVKHIAKGSEMMDRGFLDSLQRGFELSGQMGKTQFITDAMRQAQFGGSGVASLLGPTASSIDGAFRFAKGTNAGALSF